MKDPVPTVLSMVLVLSVFATAGLCFWYLQCTRKHNAVQFEVERITRNRNTMQSLLNDAMEYSKKNPAILPVLQGISAKSRATNSTSVPPR